MLNYRRETQKGQAIYIKKYKIYAFLALALGIGMMGYGGGRLLEAEQIYREGSAVYEDLSGQVRKSVSAALPPTHENIENTQIMETPQEKEAQKAQVYIPKYEIDFGVLKSVNKDAAAWLYCPDTVIDYPVMRADDYSYYLNHLPDGTVNGNGSLFIDYNCASDFSEPLTVVYGHHMKSGNMFGSLVGYKGQKYYEEHPFMYLYTEHGNYRIDVLYGCIIGAGQWRARAFMCAENIDALLAYAAHNTTFESEAAYSEGDRLIAMSTCSYEFNDARYVVIGILKAEYE